MTGEPPVDAARDRGLRVTGLALRHSIEFDASCSQTLRRWHDTVNARRDEVARPGFDERCRRMWNFYLTSCAGSFKDRNCDLVQITVTCPA